MRQLATKQIRFSLYYFFIAACFGLFLRLLHHIDLPVTYKFIVHTHSHIALMGWVYLSVTAMLAYYFIKPSAFKQLHRLFWFTQLTLVGMLISFPFVGYAVFSIIFSTLFLLATYWFCWLFYKENNTVFKHSTAKPFIVISLFFLLLSSIGPWSLGMIMNTLGSTSIWYRLSVYFYLHFQYNGFMIMALVGLFLFLLEQHATIPKKVGQLLCYVFTVGVILSFMLSALFFDHPIWFNYIGLAGATFQLIGFGLLIAYLRNYLPKPYQFSWLSLSVVILFLFKLILQWLSGLPQFSNYINQTKELIVGYLHLTFLGVITCALFVFLERFFNQRLSPFALSLYGFGFVGSEVLIFYKGLSLEYNLPSISYYYPLLSIISATIPLAVFVLITRLKTNYREKSI